MGFGADYLNVSAGTNAAYGQRLNNAQAMRNDQTEQDKLNELRAKRDMEARQRQILAESPMPQLNKYTPVPGQLPDAPPAATGTVGTATGGGPGWKTVRPPTPESQLPTDNSIEVSEASNRLQALRRQDTQAAKDRRALAKVPAAVVDVVQSPAAGLLNLSGDIAEGAMNLGGRLVNAVAGKDIVQPAAPAAKFSLTPMYDRLVRQPEAQMDNAQRRLRELQAQQASAPAAPKQAYSSPAQYSEATKAMAASRADRNNNPGNIEYGPFAKAAGATGSDGRFAIFPDAQTGAAAVDKLLQTYAGQGINTVAGIVGKWSPAADPGNGAASTNNYVAAVAGALGVQPNQPLNMADPQVRQALAQAMAKREGYTGNGSAQTAPAAQAPAAQAPAQVRVGATYMPNVSPAFAQRELSDMEAHFNLLSRMAQVERDPAKALEARANLMALSGAYTEKQLQQTARTGDLAGMVQFANLFGHKIGAANAGNGMVVLVDNGQQSQPMSQKDAVTYLYQGISPLVQQMNQNLAAKAQEAMLKARGEIAVENVKGANARELAQIHGNNAQALEIQKTLAQMGMDANSFTYTTNTLTGATIAHAKYGKAAFELVPGQVVDGVQLASTMRQIQ